MHKNSKVIFFFPHNPYPPQSGAHKRSLEMLSGLKELGCKVTLVSSYISSCTAWSDESIRGLEKDYVEKVYIYKSSFLDRQFQQFMKILNVLYKLTNREQSLVSAIHTPYGMRHWFSKILEEISPHFIFMNYAYWDGLLKHNALKSIPRILETHDLLTLNIQMQSALSPYLTKSVLKTGNINEELLDENYFTKLDLKPSEEEFKIIDQYNYTIAISNEEAKLIQKNTTNTKVVLIPVTHEHCNLQNTYAGASIFPVGPNPFNIQGYLYFIKKVLPKILKSEPSFSVDVTGLFWKNVTIEPPGIQLKGFITDLKTVYQQAGFLICPVFGGTGQQVKVVEAMAYGLPVVALRQAADRSPIEHGVNGFIANDADEFANYALQLWNDRELCRRLGIAARKTIANNFSRERTMAGLSKILQ
jgi:glycosyltransferase involved in cell wall biosynthesis